MSKPLFSVVCPTYNSAEFIGNTLKSVIEQTYAASEIVVVDDGSTDNTVQIILAVKKISSIPIRLIEGKHAGPGVARNLGINAAMNEWIAFIDSDDFWCSEKLAVVALSIEKNPLSNIFCHGEYHVSKDGKITEVDYGQHYDYKAKLSPQLYMRNYFSTSAVVCSKGLIKKHHGFDEQMMNAQDYELWLKISGDAIPFFISQHLGKYQLRDGNVTSRSVDRKFINLVIIAWRYRYYVSLPIRVLKVAKMAASYIKQTFIRLF